MHKIVVEKDEAVADLIERILEVEDNDLTLVIPKKSHLLDSESNFRLLAREAKVLNKNIAVESVDENVLGLAKKHGLESIHPLFDERADGQPMSDILPQKGRAGRKPKRSEEDFEARAVPLKVQHDESEEELEDDSAEEETGERFDTLSDYREPSPVAKWAGITAGVLIAMVLLLWGFGAMFGRAEISIHFKRTPWSFEDPVAALTSVKDIDMDRNVIPGQLFEEEKSLVQSFPASGRAVVNDKAKGTITVVNAYSSDPQSLVATTRFETPAGKIYRLDSAIVVPGAQVVDGKITPASIKAPVTADKAGPDYNSGRVEKLTIPGFKGGPKYDGFYGVLEDGISGGVTGERPVATDQDVEAAKAKVSDTLKSAFQTTFLGSIPTDIRVLDGASAIQSGKLSVNRTAGQDGKFTTTGTAIFEAFGFREKDLMSFLTTKASSSKSGSKLIDVKLDYQGIAPDFMKKQLKFSLKADANLVPDFKADEFVGQIQGKKRDEVKAMILGLPELADAQVTLWPSWLRSLPGSGSRITVNVE